MRVLGARVVNVAIARAKYARNSGTGVIASTVGRQTSEIPASTVTYCALAFTASLACRKSSATLWAEIEKLSAVRAGCWALMRRKWLLTSGLVPADPELSLQLVVPEGEHERVAAVSESPIAAILAQGRHLGCPHGGVVAGWRAPDDRRQARERDDPHDER